MKFINRLMYNRKRAVSPVIAVILLIGLAVAASAAIFIVILPLLEPTSSVEINQGDIIYDTEYTTALDEGQGYGKGTVTVLNTGTGEVEITSIKIYWATSFADDWTEITDATSIQGITVNNPWVLEPIAGSGDDLHIRFPIPTENINNSLSYKIILIPNEGRNLDTSRTDMIDDTDMQLDADRPDISYTGSLGIIRRTPSTISPNSATDNSVIKNVTFEVFYDSSGLPALLPHTITSTSAWNWNWNTINSTTQGLDNGTYTMKMTVNDYAGLSDYVNMGSFIIDNDYTEPTIGGLWLTDPYSENQTAEVGERAYFTININDTGTLEPSASIVDTATLYYRINDSVDLYSTAIMGRYGETNNWTAYIPSGDVGSTALEEGIECYVLSSDYDGNEANSSGNLTRISVDDHYEPNIAHFAVPPASVTDSFINITATITDEDQVNETTVRLYYRQTDDYGGVTESWNSITPNIAGNEYSWIIWSTDITIHGLDYYFNATDRFSGHVASEGDETDPNHIDIPDEQYPVITHAEIATATNDTALDIDVTIFDNDPSFGAEGDVSGTLTLYYRDYDGGGGFDSVGMDWASGNSSIDSNGETPSSTLWYAIIPASAIESDGDPRLDYYIEAEDNSSNSDQHGVPYHTAVVLPQGEPNIVYVADSMMVSGSIGEEIKFTVEHVDGSKTNAIIAGLNLTIFGGTGDIPILNMTQFDSTTVWSNGTEFNRNSTWITFTTNASMNEDTTANITMTFENMTNQPYSMYDLDFILELRTYNTQDSPSISTLDLSTPPGQQTIDDLLYMTNAYTLTTAGSTSATETGTGQQFEWSQPTITWGIRVFVGGIEISGGGLVAPVTGVIEDTRVRTQGYWNYLGGASIDPSDSIIVSVRVIIDTTEHTLGDFSTGPLGATELSASQWKVNYWVRWRSPRTSRYQAFFCFGDNTSPPTTWDSYVDGLTYVVSG